ncbi:MAG TPA: zinc ribbon domain-containing protein [Dehalococcoidia bacterium]|nr:zinc ribbon domain-containing protein [Dehalococcoidia bacterium]
MPIYEYECPNCRHRDQLYVRSVNNQPSPPACPQCGQEAMRRLISRALYIQDEATKVEQLDPKYEKMIDDADKPFKANDPLKRITGTPLYPD